MHTCTLPFKYGRRDGVRAMYTHTLAFGKSLFAKWVRPTLIRSTWGRWIFNEASCRNFSGHGDGSVQQGTSSQLRHPVCRKCRRLYPVLVEWNSFQSSKQSSLWRGNTNRVTCTTRRSDFGARDRSTLCAPTSLPEIKGGEPPSLLSKRFFGSLTFAANAA